MVYKSLRIDGGRNKNCGGKWINPFKYYHALPIAHGLNRGL
jgi:hypothetical protein